MPGSDLNTKNRITVSKESFSYQNQSEILKVPEEWLSDERCFICGYCRDCLPRLCHCFEPIGSGQTSPKPPNRVHKSTYYRNGDRRKKSVVRQRLQDSSIGSNLNGNGMSVTSLTAASFSRDLTIDQQSLSQQQYTEPADLRSEARGLNRIARTLTDTYQDIRSLSSGYKSGLIKRSNQGQSKNENGLKGQKKSAKKRSKVNAMNTLFEAGHEDDLFHPSRRLFQPRPSLSNELGPTVIRSSKWNQMAKKGGFLDCIDDECLTLRDVLFRGRKISGGAGICLGWRPTPRRPYHWITYNEVIHRSHCFGSGLLNMGLEPGPNSLVGIFSRNCVEWMLAEVALHTFSMVLVPIYDQLSPEAKSYIISESEMKLIICSGDDTVSKILEQCPDCLKAIVTINSVKTRTLEKATHMGIQVVRFQDIEEYGGANLVPEVPPQPQNPAIICFNHIAAFGDIISGRPKGVMLSHRNIVACASACIKQLEPYAPRSSDVMISFLPMAHMLERICQVAVLMSGGAIGFYCGDIHFLTDDLKQLKPTIVPAVPRFLNRIYDSVVNRVNQSNVKRAFFNIGLRKKTKELGFGIVRGDTFWDRLLFRSVKDLVGGKVRLLVVGSAPLSETVLTFLRATLGCIIIEGYGQTECTACCTLSVQGDSMPGHVGPPLPCCVVKLADVPDMEYFATNGQGEICIRGSNVFIGYFKDPDKTKRVIDDEGWLHTGDIGQWLSNGTLKVIDRKKHIFKLSQGEYVSPENIEAVYRKSPFVAQAFVHGDSLRSRIVVVVVPELEPLKQWAEMRSIPSISFTLLCSNSKVRDLIKSEIQRLAEAENLQYFEVAKDVYLHPDLFSQQNGLLNSGGKLKRKTLEKYFKPQLEDLYNTQEEGSH